LSSDFFFCQRELEYKDFEVIMFMQNILYSIFFDLKIFLLI